MTRHLHCCWRTVLGTMTLLQAAASAGGRGIGAAPSVEVSQPRVHSCTVSDLSIKTMSSGAKSNVPVHGGVVWTVRLSLIRSSHCTLRGWAHVRVLNAAHHLNNNPISYATNAQWGSIGVTTVAPSRHMPVSFWLETSEGATPATCTEGKWYLRMSLPGSNRSTTLGQPNSHPEPCPGVSLLVSPFHPASVPLFSSFPPKR